MTSKIVPEPTTLLERLKYAEKHHLGSRLLREAIDRIETLEKVNNAWHRELKGLRDEYDEVCNRHASEKQTVEKLRQRIEGLLNP